MDPSQVRSPLGDITNTANQVLLDRNEKKRQKAKERYASMSREQKDEINRKARERRAEKKVRDQERPHGEVETRCMEENAPNETHGQGMDENAPNETHEQGIVEPLGMVSIVDDANERRRQRYASMPQNNKDEINRKRREKRMENKGRVQETTNTTGGDHVLHYSWHEQDIRQENVTGPRPTYQTFDACTGSDGQLKGKEITMEINNDPFNEESPRTGLCEIDGTKGLHSICSQAEKETIIQQSTHNQDVGGQLNFRHIHIEDNHSGADHPIIHDLHGGKVKRLMILCMGRCFSSTWFIRFNHSG